MKKILCALAIGFCFISASDTAVYAQNTKKIIEPGIKKNFIASVRHLATLMNPDLSGVNLLSRNEINIWAIRDFLDRFDTVENALWFSIPKGGCEAYFVLDGYGDRVMYDRSGDWLMSLITYSEDKLPGSIRTIVKSTYFDFNIILVEEVHTQDGFEYIVYLEYNSNIRLIMVDKEGKMEVLQDLNNG